MGILLVILDCPISLMVDPLRSYVKIGAAQSSLRRNLGVTLHS